MSLYVFPLVESCHYFFEPQKHVGHAFFSPKNTPAGRWRMKFTYKLKLKYLSSSVMFLSEVEIERFVSLNHCSLGVFFLGSKPSMNQFDMNTKGIQCHPPYFRNFSSKISLEQLVFYSCPSRKGPLMLGVLGVCKDLQKNPWQISEIRIHRQRVIGFNADTKTWNFYDEALEMSKFHIELFEGIV